MSSRTKNSRPSVVRRREDDALIHKILAESNGAEYQESINPFEGLRRDRFERLYKRYRVTWLDTEWRFNDLCEVYGTVLTRRT